VGLIKISPPPLGTVAQGVATLWAVEATAFNRDASLLWVRTVYSDSAYPALQTRSALWSYDLKLGQYQTAVNTIIASDRAIEVASIAVASTTDSTQLVAIYRNTVAQTGLDLNQVALIKDGVVVQSDLLTHISGNQADALIDVVKMSANGRFVAVETSASNLAAELDTNACKDIYLFDLVLNTSRRITVTNGLESSADSLLGDVLVAADGTVSVAFQSAHAFTARDSNGVDDVFVWRLLPGDYANNSAGAITLVSQTANGATGGRSPLLNRQGALFTSESGAYSSADQNNASDIWQAGDTTPRLVSAAATGPLLEASSLASTSVGGRYVAIVTASPEIAADTLVEQLVVVDTSTQTGVVVSKSTSGVLADDSVISPVVSANGRWVAFSSQAGNLTSDVPDGLMHLYVADLQSAPDSAPPTGSVTINGTATQGQTLTATNTLADLDGLGTISYQWSAGGVAINGATSGTIALTPAQAGKAITVTASYTDGQGTAESSTSNAVAVSANTQLDILAYTWKAHTLLSDVSVANRAMSHATAGDGAIKFEVTPAASQTLTASRAVPSAEASLTSSAVNLQDAISILKMIVGLDVNAAGKPLSPYQALAADYDGNGVVQLTDAIGVLKHVVGLTAPQPAWHFVNELDATVPNKANLRPGTPQTSISANTSGGSPVHVGLVGYLNGDVDGSFAGAPGALDLDALQPGYFNSLAAASGLNLTQFGVYSTTL
jgi:hypothetical protein